MSLGFVLRYGKKLYEPFLEFGILQMKKVLKDTLLADFDVNSINLGEMMTSVSVGLIAGGLALFILAFLGCCGACYRIRCLLWLYAIVIIVFVIAEAVGVGLLFGKPDLVKDQLKYSLKDYKGLASAEVMSLTWNVVMIQFKCCGVDNSTDFQEHATSWVRNITISPGRFISLETPIACCKSLPSTNDSLSFTCALHGFNISLSNAATGCYKTIWDLSFGNNAISIPVLVVSGIIQLLFICCAIMIAKDNDKVSPI